MNLSDEVFAWLRGQAEREIETSCARVFLVGDRALKVKKPVDYGFLDYSTLAKRRWALQRELSFNQATAPDIYRRVLEIKRGADGALNLGGKGETVDLALEMRRFDPDDVLAEHPERVDGVLAEALGRTIARFHAGAEVRPEGGGVKALGYTIRTNAEHLLTLGDQLGAAEVRTVVEGTDAAFAAAAPLLERRRAEGFARRCHGDLHLGNILMEDAEPRLFDCIEFNDLLSEIDVLYDAAFLVMDLGFRGNAAGANRALNAYLDEAARSFAPVFYDGLAALPVMLSARASVRAHVSAMQGDLDAGRAYLAAARRLLTAHPPRLVAVGGLSGSGKSTLARKIAPDLGRAPGAVILRSDEIRKRQAGIGPFDPLPDDAYGAAASERVYDEMFTLAERILHTGHAVILDAVFLRPEERAAAEAVARAAKVPFQGVWLEGDAGLLRERMAARTGDASDADAEVLATQLERDPGTIGWRIGDAGDLDAAARAVTDD